MLGLGTNGRLSNDMELRRSSSHELEKHCGEMIWDDDLSFQVKSERVFFAEGDVSDLRFTAQGARAFDR